MGCVCVLKILVTRSMPFPLAGLRSRPDVWSSPSFMAMLGPRTPLRRLVFGKAVAPAVVVCRRSTLDTILRPSLYLVATAVGSAVWRLLRTAVAMLADPFILRLVPDAPKRARPFGLSNEAWCERLRSRLRRHLEEARIARMPSCVRERAAARALGEAWAAPPSAHPSGAHRPLFRTGTVCMHMMVIRVGSMRCMYFVQGPSGTLRRSRVRSQVRGIGG